MLRLKPKRIAVLLAVVLYVSSLFLPAFSYVPFLGDARRPFSYFYGWAALPFGPVAMLFLEFAASAWAANPIFFGALLSSGFGRYRLSAILAAMSLAIGAAFFPLSALHPVIIPLSGEGETLNYPKPILGFYLWMAAFFVIFLTALIADYRQRHAKAVEKVAAR